MDYSRFNILTFCSSSFSYAFGFFKLDFEVSRIELTTFNQFDRWNCIVFRISSTYMESSEYRINSNALTCIVAGYRIWHLLKYSPDIPLGYRTSQFIKMSGIPHWYIPTEFHMCVIEIVAWSKKLPVFERVRVVLCVKHTFALIRVSVA